MNTIVRIRDSNPGPHAQLLELNYLNPDSPSTSISEISTKHKIIKAKISMLPFP